MIVCSLLTLWSHRSIPMFKCNLQRSNEIETFISYEIMLLHREPLAHWMFYFSCFFFYIYWWSFPWSRRFTSSKWQQRGNEMEWNKTRIEFRTNSHQREKDPPFYCFHSFAHKLICKLLSLELERREFLFVCLCVGSKKSKKKKKMAKEKRKSVSQRSKKNEKYIEIMLSAENVARFKSFHSIKIKEMLNSSPTIHWKIVCVCRSHEIHIAALWSVVLWLRKARLTTKISLHWLNESGGSKTEAKQSKIQN